MRAKLVSDVNVLNHAVKLYMAEGGRLDDVSTPQEVIDRLKTTSTAEVARRHVGPVTGRLVDPRLAAQDLSDSQLGTDTPRAVWNPTLQRFVVKTSGAGVGFNFDDAEDSADTEEARQRSSMLFNRTDGWIWEWGGHPEPKPLEPRDFTLTSGGTPVPPAPYPNPTPVPPVPGPSGTVQPSPVPLPPPTILPDGGIFSVATFPAAILISANVNDSNARLQYRLDSGSWKTYGMALVVPPGTRVSARNISLDPVRYLDSLEDTELYLRRVALFTGSVTPQWANIEGKHNLKQSIDNSRVNDIKARHGEPSDDEDSPNTLSFLRTGFISIPPDTDFKVGQLVYYNGTVESNTEATAIDLKLNLQLLAPTIQSGTAAAHLSLWSSSNTNDEKKSADYVQLDNPQTNFAVKADGMTYTLQLRFANVKADEGWTDGTKLYVYEDSLGHGDLIGRFVSGY